MKKLGWMMSMVMVILLSFSDTRLPITFANNVTPVSIRLVLGDNVTLEGYVGQDDETIFHRNVVALTGIPGSALPRQVNKPGATFSSWVYAEGATLVKVTEFPLTSGAIYFPYFAEGSNAFVQPDLQTITLYLDATFWAEANPVFYAYSFASETAGSWPGTRLTPLSDSLYVVTLPRGMSKVIFSRYSAPVNEAGQLWNQTADLTFHPTVNLFIINSWNQSNAGYWSVYSN